MNDALEIRAAGPEDCGLVLRFIRELADYERLLHEVVADEETLRATLFGPEPSARVVIAESAGQAVGFALFHEMYSTFIARPGVYLEDLYISPEFRGHGYGKALLAYLARMTVENNYCRLDWSCLTWNEPSVRFYKRIGARELSDWTRFRLDDEALEAVARSA